MRKRIFTILPIISCVAMGPAMANWQYDGVYVGDGWYEDDGSRFTMSFRAGAAMGFGSIKNDIGDSYSRFYVDDAGNIITASDCFASGDCTTSGYELAGYGNIGNLPVAKKFESFAFTGGFSIGWTLPYRPQWRFEGGWDHIMKSDYNASPLFEGTLELSGGTMASVQNAAAGSMTSTIQSDIISAMVFYDFFDGTYKPLRTFIPYVGFGIGYADTTTDMHLTDAYGNLSDDNSLLQFGTIYEGDPYQLINFYQSKYSNANVAGLLAAGFSYGLTETMFVDFGARMTYIPNVKWMLSNEDNSNHHDWLRINGLMYLNMTLGLRFEF